MERNQNRETHFDILRILSTVAFVVMLVAFRGFKLGDAGTSRVLNAYLALSSFGMPMFILLSGAFLADPNRPFTVKGYVRRILRLLIPMVVWAVLYAGISVLMTGVPQGMGVFKFLKEFFKLAFLSRYHIAYLFAMLGLYLAIPLFRQIAKCKHTTEWFLLLALVFAWLIPTLQLIPSVWKLNYILEQLQLHVCLGYGGLFLLGWYLRAHPLKKAWRIVLYVAAACCVAALYCFFRYYSFSYADLPVYNRNYLPQVVIVAAIFVFFANVGAKWSFSDNARRRIAQLSGASYGVYLISVMVAAFLGWFGSFLSLVFPSVDPTAGLTATSFAPIVAVPVTALAVLLISYPISLLVRKIPVVGKYLM